MNIIFTSLWLCKLWHKAHFTNFMMLLPVNVDQWRVNLIVAGVNSLLRGLSDLVRLRTWLWISPCSSSALTLDVICSGFLTDLRRRRTKQKSQQTETLHFGPGTSQDRTAAQGTSMRNNGFTCNFMRNGLKRRKKNKRWVFVEGTEKKREAKRAGCLWRRAIENE